jgi:hypothetical protein
MFSHAGQLYFKETDDVLANAYMYSETCESRINQEHYDVRVTCCTRYVSPRSESGVTISVASEIKVSDSLNNI